MLGPEWCRWVTEGAVVEINDPDARIVDLTVAPEGNIASGINTWIFCVALFRRMDRLHFIHSTFTFYYAIYQWGWFPADVLIAVPVVHNRYGPTDLTVCQERMLSDPGLS